MSKPFVARLHAIFVGLYATRVSLGARILGTAFCVIFLALAWML